MTLADLVACQPHLFYNPSRCAPWWADERFVTKEALAVEMPSGFVPMPDVREARRYRKRLPAASWAALYVQRPTETWLWRNYIWCSDVDRDGSLVYVGGTSNGRGLEIHREYDLTKRWGVPVW